MARLKVQIWVQLLLTPTMQMFHEDFNLPIFATFVQQIIAFFSLFKCLFTSLLLWIRISAFLFEIPLFECLIQFSKSSNYCQAIKNPHEFQIQDPSPQGTTYFRNSKSANQTFQWNGLQWDGRNRMNITKDLS